MLLCAAPSTRSHETGHKARRWAKELITYCISAPLPQSDQTGRVKVAFQRPSRNKLHSRGGRLLRTVRPQTSNDFCGEAVSLKDRCARGQRSSPEMSRDALSDHAYDASICSPRRTFHSQNG